MARNAHPEATRRRILEAAQRLFSERGYANTTIQDILDELGDLSKGAIYHHFSNKEAILEALTEDDWNAHWKMANEMLDRTDITGLEKLRELIRASTTDDAHLATNRESAQFLEDPTTLAHNLEWWQTTIAEWIERIIRQGVEDGSITTEYPHEAAVLFSLLLNYWVGDAPSVDQVEPRLRCVATMLAALGLPVLDEEMIRLTIHGVGEINRPRFEQHG